LVYARGAYRTDAHRWFFGTSVKFGQECNRIVSLARDIDVSVPTSDPAIARHVQQYLDTVAPRPNATMRDSARECIYMTLPSGLCSAERVARYLGVDRRTLHRHLEREGDTFSSLLDAVRAPNRRPATLVTTTARSSQLRNYSAFLR